MLEAEVLSHKKFRQLLEVKEFIKNIPLSENRSLMLLWAVTDLTKGPPKNSITALTFFDQLVWIWLTGQNFSSSFGLRWRSKSKKKKRTGSTCSTGKGSRYEIISAFDCDQCLTCLFPGGIFVRSWSDISESWSVHMNHERDYIICAVIPRMFSLFWFL